MRCSLDMPTLVWWTSAFGVLVCRVPARTTWPLQRRCKCTHRAARDRAHRADGSRRSSPTSRRSYSIKPCQPCSCDACEHSEAVPCPGHSRSLQVQVVQVQQFGFTVDASHGAGHASSELKSPHTCGTFYVRVAVSEARPERQPQHEHLAEPVIAQLFAAPTPWHPICGCDGSICDIVGPVGSRRCWRLARLAGMSPCRGGSR